MQTAQWFLNLERLSYLLPQLRLIVQLCTAGAG